MELELRELYDKMIDICKKKNEDKLLKGSWCFILLEDETGCWCKSPFSDWGDMDYVFYNYGFVYDETVKKRISFFDYVYGDSRLYRYHIDRVKQFDLWADCDTLMRYLLLIKQFVNDKDVVNDLYQKVAKTKIKLKHFLIDDDFTDVYLLLGVIDTIQYDMNRSDLPELYLLKRYFRYIDDIRTEIIEELYEEE